MNKRFKVMLIALSAHMGNAVANEISSKVTDVTVYTNSATVTRTATFDLPVGDHRVELVGFPAQLDTETLKLEASKSAIKIGQVSIRQKPIRDAQDPQVIALDKEKLNLEQKIQEVKDSTKSAEMQLKFLDSLATGYSKEAWVGSAQANADPNSWQRALGLMQSGSSDSYKIIRDNKLRLVELAKDLAVVKEKRDQLSGDSLATSIVVVNLTVTESGNADILVRYQQWNARWRPAYEARLDTDSSKLTVIQNAVVEQETNEPWLNSKVTLSTSQPLAQMDAPQVQSEFIDLYQRPTPASSPRRSAAADQEFQLEEVIVTASNIAAPTWSGNFASSFTIPGRINVSNNSDETQRYDLQTFEFTPELITQIVPRQQTTAYLAARVTNTSEVPLYSSEMQVFVDGVLMGNSELPTLLPGSQAVLPMGQDRRIEVSVKDLGGLGGESGLISKQRSEVRDLVFEIINRRSSTANIEVRDVYPVPKNKAIKIKIGDKATRPTERNENDKAGVVVWKKEVAADETWRINYNYRLSYPADETIQRVTGR